MNLYAKSKKITISNGTTHTHDIISYLPFQAERLIWKANISDCDEDKKRLFQYLAPIAERSWSGNLLAHRLTQDIDQDRLQSAYETFHGDHHQYQSHQTHHHVISSLSQYTYQPGRSLQDQECDKIDQCDYSDQRTLKVNVEASSISMIALAIAPGPHNIGIARGVMDISSA